MHTISWVFRTSLKAPALAFLSVFLAAASALAEPTAGPAQISVVLNAAGASPEQPIRTWSGDAIVGLRRSTTREKATEAGPVVSWQGPLLSDFIKESMKGLPLSQQASVDLLVFKNRTGAHVAIPRWLVTRYPVLLATPKGGGHSSFNVVLPWTSRPAIRNENVPTHAYAISDVVSVELSSYDQVYHSFYLKKRNDPVAMKGEKLFVQNCTSCHSLPSGGPGGLANEARAAAEPQFSISDLAMSPRTRQLASQGHPAASGAPAVTESDARALTTYLDAFKNENHPPAPTD